MTTFSVARIGSVLPASVDCSNTLVTSISDTTGDP